VVHGGADWVGALMPVGNEGVEQDGVRFTSRLHAGAFLVTAVVGLALLFALAFVRPPSNYSVFVAAITAAVTHFYLLGAAERASDGQPTFSGGITTRRGRAVYVAAFRRVRG
jgi:hypothetical protein